MMGGGMMMMMGGGMKTKMEEVTGGELLAW